MPERRMLDLDGDTVAAVVHTPDGDCRGSVVFCHGFGSDKAGSYEHRAALAAEEGFRAVRFDFRGNNESSLDFAEATLSTRIDDLRRVLDEVADDHVGVYGASFGGLVAIQTAVRDDRIDVLALRDPVTFMVTLDDIREEIHETGSYEQLPGKKVDERFLEDLDRFSTERILEQILVPTLVMHGTEDDVIDIEHSKRFFRRLGCTKRFEAFEGEGHRFSDEADDAAVRLALDWFASHGDG